MNKADLIAAAALKADVSKSDAEKVIGVALELIEAALMRGEEVKLSGFGIFEKKSRAARAGTNPANGIKIEIPASATVSFKPSKGLKEKLN